MKAEAEHEAKPRRIWIVWECFFAWQEKVMPPTGLREFVAQAKNILSMRRTLGTIRASVQNWEMNVGSPRRKRKLEGH